MSNNPLISVIMNCYNGDKYLKEAIDSVRSQTYDNWEIIFWDNQSTDQSANIVQSYKDVRINYYFSDEHTPLGEARNKAASKARGEWIAILDCDDIWFEDKLEKQVSNISDGVGIVYSRAEFLIEVRGNPTSMSKSIKTSYYPKRKSLPSGHIINELFSDCFIPLPSVLLHANTFFEVGGIDPTLKVAEDYDIFLKIAEKSTVISLDEPLCKYRVHSDNLSHSNTHTTFIESIDLVERYSNKYNIKIPLTIWKIRYIKHLVKELEISKALIMLIRLNPMLFFKVILGRKYAE